MQIFQQFFEPIVELCLEARLEWGEELYFDSTKVDKESLRTKQLKSAFRILIKEHAYKEPGDEAAHCLGFC